MHSSYAPRHHVRRVGRITVVALIAGLLQFFGVGPASADVPLGNAQTVESVDPGRVHLRGFAIDPDDLAAATTIHVYIGSAFINIGPANQYRADIAQAFPMAGGNHGFDTTIDVTEIGTLAYKVEALDTQGGEPTIIGRGQVAVADPTPSGFVAAVTSPAHRTVSLSGWASDPNAPKTPVRIEVYVGGSFSTPGVEYHPLTADVVRSDGKPGFSGEFITDKRGEQEIYVYAQNLAGTPGTARLLGIFKVTINIDTSPPQTSIDSAPKVATPNDVIAVKFSADEPNSTFECRWDKAPFATCPSTSLITLPPGQHTIEVRAIDKAGNTDPTPASATVVVSNFVTQPPLPAAERTIKVRAAKKKSKLRIDVDPDSTTSDYRVTIQRKAGKKWVTAKRARTRGTSDTIVVNLPRGKYRVVLPKSDQGLTITSSSVRLKR